MENQRNGHPDSKLDEPRAHLIEFGAAGEDLEDELRDRSEHISQAREAAYERGQDAYEPGGDRDAMAAQYYDHPKLCADFCDGWEEAADWDDGDSFACSMDPSMRDTHGLPGRDL